VLDVKCRGEAVSSFSGSCRGEQASANHLHYSARRRPMTVQAMKGGAIEFLTKPFRDQDLLEAVQAGLARDRARRESDKALGDLRERFDTLSSREREIMMQVTAGRLNKQIATISHRRIHGKVHRTHLMRKMKARSFPEPAEWPTCLSWHQKSLNAPNWLDGVSKPSLSVTNQ
jgi:DNA-binding NtrC family response regulator